MREQINALLSFKENKGHHLQRERKKNEKKSLLFTLNLGSSLAKDRW